MSSVRDRVRELLESTELADPHAIAGLLLPELKGKAKDEALAECLPQYVRLLVSAERGHLRLDRPREQPTSHTTPGRSSRSPKWENVSRVFRLRVFADGWRQLGDCTAEHLMFLADDRYAKAKELTSSGDRWSALRDLLVRKGATHVRELPESEVAEVLS